MEECYPVLMENRPVGKVQLLRQGLYCRVSCRCRILSDQVLRLYGVTEKGRTSLGVVVPEGDCLVLDRKIPEKHLGKGEISFFLSPGAGYLDGKFVPICPEEPFLYITRLKDAFLEYDRGRPGIRIQKTPGAV